MLWRCAGLWHHRCAGLLQAGQGTLIPATKTCAPGVDFLRQNASTTTSGTENHTKLKTIDDLPGPSQMRTLYWLCVKGYFRYLHQFQIEQSKVWGPLWKSRYGPLRLVNVASGELIEQVLRQDGRTPVRTDMPHWRSYRELRNKAYGPLTEIGEKWLHIRNILNPRLLKPKHVSSYTDTMNEVVTDFIHKLTRLRDTSRVVHNLVDELYNFSFESICSVLFETRMGCMEETIPEETQRFIFSVGEMMRLSQMIMIIPRPLWPYMPLYWKFVDTWEYLFKVSEELIQRKINELEHKVDLAQNIDGAYLTHLLLSERMTVDEILGSVTELLMAGIDTTSNTMCWALYHLAREPEVQEQLYQEVKQVCPGGRTPTTEDTAKMPFMKAVIKETLRMYPSVPSNARLTVDKEIIVGDYVFPKNTLFHLCHFAASYDERSFPNAQAFQPQRWLRGSEHKAQMHPFGSIPFGFGTRACLGRRVAELEMYLLLIRLIQQFEFRPDPAGTEVKPMTRTMLCPEKNISLQFIDRTPEAARSHI